MAPSASARSLFDFPFLFEDSGMKRFLELLVAFAALSLFAALSTAGPATPGGVKEIVLVHGATMRPQAFQPRLAASSNLEKR